MAEFKFGAIRERKPHPDKLESTLGQWLHYIFPNDDIIQDCHIPVNIWELRSGCKIPYQRYRPDARIEYRSIIVEFDGIHHYNSVQNIQADAKRDTILRRLGYEVIRIPFFVQLTQDVIQHLFRIHVDQGCVVPSGFYSTTHNPAQANPFCPANFCPAGLNRFYRDLERMPRSTIAEVLSSLEAQCATNPEYLVMPEELHRDCHYWKRWNDHIKELCKKYES